MFFQTTVTLLILIVYVNIARWDKTVVCGNVRINGRGVWRVPEKDVRVQTFKRDVSGKKFIYT